MSIWDVLIIAAICLAIFRGYFKGLCHRLSGWVGMVVALCVASFGVSSTDSLISRVFDVNGEEKVASWLQDYFSTRVAANPTNQLESLKQWAANLFLPDALKENLYNAIDSSADEIYVSIYDQVARVMAGPLWHLLCIIIGTIVCYALLVLIGEVCGVFVRRFHVSMIIDRFLGAIASGFLITIPIAIFTAICVFTVPENAGWLGRALHNSFMGPTLMQAVETLIRGGLFF